MQLTHWKIFGTNSTRDVGTHSHRDENADFAVQSTQCKLKIFGTKYTKDVGTL